MKAQLPNPSATRDDEQRREPTEDYRSNPAPGHQRPSAVTSLLNESSEAIHHSQGRCCFCSS